MVCTGFLNPLDLECLLVNTLSGSWTIFILLCMLCFLILAGKFKMPNVVIGLIVVSFSIIFFEQANWLFLLVALVGIILIMKAIWDKING